MTAPEFVRTAFIRFDKRGQVYVRQEYWKRVSPARERGEPVGEWRDVPVQEEARE